MNEIVDRIEHVLMEAARRRTARRRRRTIAAAAVAGVLLLVSAASAVTGVGPLGEALTADDELPVGAEPAPGGESVTLAGATDDGRRQEVRVYRRRPHPRKRSGLGDLPGAYHYCAASYSAERTGKRAQTSVSCTLGTVLALDVVRHRLWLGCSGSGGGIVGRPSPAAPVCGLTLAGTRRVTMEADRGRVSAVELSPPFLLRVNREPAIVRREGGIDPAVARRLPAVVRVRAVLGVLDAAPTQPGAHTPRITVTAVGGYGTVHGHVGGDRWPVATDLPSYDPTPRPGAARARITARGADGASWTTKAWTTTHDDHCAAAAPARGQPPRDPSILCAWRAELGRYRSLAHGEAVAMFTRAGPRDAPRTYAVYGFVRSDVERVDVKDPRGASHTAELSRPWTTFRRRRGDLLPIPPKYRRRFARLPRSMRVRVFLAVVPGARAPRNGKPIGILTVRGGSVAESHPLHTPPKGASGLTAPVR